MVIPLKMLLIGIDPYPYGELENDSRILQKSYPEVAYNTWPTMGRVLLFTT
jgi:hypothetical protein